MCKDLGGNTYFCMILGRKDWRRMQKEGISSRGGHVGAGMELSPPICRVAAARAGPTGITEQISDPALKIPSIWDHSQYSYFQTLQIPQFAGAKDKIIFLIFSTNFQLRICQKKLNRMFKELFLLGSKLKQPPWNSSFYPVSPIYRKLF